MYLYHVYGDKVAEKRELRRWEVLSAGFTAAPTMPAVHRRFLCFCRWILPLGDQGSTSSRLRSTRIRGTWKCLCARYVKMELHAVDDSRYSEPVLTQ